MIKGEIYRGRKPRHPIVFIGEKNSDQFIGCMLTHSPSKVFQNNVRLKFSYFDLTDENGEKYSTRFSRSYFVNLKLIKKNDWGPYKLTGKLSQEGIEFIEAFIKEKSSIWWRDYWNK